MLDAKSGYKPSAIWRSLVVGKEVLKKGLRRSIGNGRMTGVWTDPWVPSKVPIVLPRPNHIETKNEKVHELRTEDGTGWDEGKLAARFEEGMRSHQKRAFGCGARGRHVDMGNGQQGGLLCENGVQMRYGGILECSMCNNEPEGVFHALVDCPELQILWAMAKYDYSSRVYHTNILEWLAMEAAEWSDEQLASLAVAIYLVWERRNKKKFASEVIHAEELWQRVERVMDELQIVTFTEDRSKSEPISFEWEKPEYPYTKLNIDASIIKEGGGALGGILRDETGACVGAYTHFVQYPNDPLLLEAMAIRNGLDLAHKVGCTHLMVESDAKMVIDILRTPCDKASTLNALYREILRSCTNFQVVNFNWIPRMCNLVADFIFRKARIDCKNVVWTDSVPLYLSEVIFDI
ncbi:putative ribonuclease H-like domain, reverse transcriptase zinc-binding domain-containing protein [Senna tora]|uniref:Putative ribonuclease H-like domain, reverse transcriptase zinc-binding domain-containing protein n=1 Tax=Senna tora TaxID=362788 RepID=A0A834W218_9FABA|nr:putative ribonuclease H-like domain, reverse transcriptase zinc-binding domain-containing protein [Senna tora]